MCTDSPTPSAWDLNVAVAVNVRGWAQETISYRALFAALALAEAGDDPPLAVRAVEENALPEGFDLASGSFASIFPGHRVVLDPEDLELAVRLARHFLGLDTDAGVVS